VLVERGVERAGGLQREEAVIARAQEVVLKAAVRDVQLIQVDAAPEAAAERADVSRLAGEVPRQLVRDAGAHLVDARLLDVRIDPEGDRFRRDRELAR